MTGTDTSNPAGQHAGETPGIDRVTDAAPADPAPDLADILRKAETEVADLKDAWLRAKAETENVRRVGQADVARAHKFAVERFASDLLGVRDAPEQYLWMHRIWRSRPRHERMNRPFPGAFVEKLRSLPWVTEADIEAIKEHSVRDTRTLLETGQDRLS